MIPQNHDKLAFATKELSGWGRYPLVSARVYEPDTMQVLHACFAEAKQAREALIARGLGRSYGDASLGRESRVLVTDKLNRMLAFDSKKGTLRCEPGLSFEDILSTFLSRGWFPPVTPGTKHVTMGGAIAADIHGKNHHKDGSFINFVDSITLLTAQRDLLRCTREENSSLFWATAGGMGLTGFITELELRLKPVESAGMIVRKNRCANLAETFKLIEGTEHEYEYSVCWIDCLAAGRDLGRSILINGRHALQSEAQSISTEEKKSCKSVPFDMPSGLLNRYSISAFNELYYRLSAGSPEERVEHFDSFFYPLDSISDWNRLYGKNGFIQYQCVLPLETSKTGMEDILALSSKRGRSSFLAVLKKFGAGHGLLSFPMPGYTLTLDMPVKAGLFDFTKELDGLVMKYGGRVYLAKDACLAPETFASMYSDLDNWLKIKKEVDPDKVFRSNLSERLHL